jgi:hypothetical protein
MKKNRKFMLAFYFIFEKPTFNGQWKNLLSKGLPPKYTRKLGVIVFRNLVRRPSFILLKNVLRFFCKGKKTRNLSCPLEPVRPDTWLPYPS